MYIYFDFWKKVTYIYVEIYDRKAFVVVKKKKSKTRLLCDMNVKMLC